MACVGGGSNAMGMFYNFIPDEGVRPIGCEGWSWCRYRYECRYDGKWYSRYFPWYEIPSAKMKMVKLRRYIPFLQALIILALT